MVSNLLDYWMGKIYEAKVIRGDVTDKSMDVFKDRLAADQALAASAKERLAGFSDDVLKRDFISRKQKEFLETALGVSNG